MGATGDGMRSVEFDISGQICPSSLLIALKEINRHKDDLRAGAVRLVFRTDNRDATVTIPDSAANMGYAVSVTKEESCYIVVVERL